MTAEKLITELNIDLSPIGIERRDDGELYYCTPENAEIFGWAGVDGIHYCTIPGFGEMIFAVSPMNPEAPVHPIAHSFRDLIRLLLSCGDMAALEQCHGWQSRQYRAFIKELRLTEEQQRILKELKARLKLNPIKDVFKYIKKLQAEFDYSSIPYADDYYDIDMNPCSPLRITEWAVSFEGGFWNNNGAAGEEVEINRSFCWGDEKWTALSAYICDEGLVMDYCIEIGIDKLNAYLDKWGLRNGDPDNLTRIEREMAENDNPLEIHFRSELVCNGKPLSSKSGCSISWIPACCLTEGCIRDTETRRIIDHYGLNTDKAWVLYRSAYRWAEKKEAELLSVKLTLKRNLNRYAGQPFVCPKKGEAVEITSPLNGEKYLLTVHDIVREEIDPTVFRDADMEYPTHCLMMIYALEPDTAAARFDLQDNCEGDSPRSKTADGPCSATAFIGRAYSPKAIGNCSEKAACSALHFDEEFSVEWVPMFSVKPMRDIQIDLM